MDVCMDGWIDRQTDKQTGTCGTIKDFKDLTLLLSESQEK